MKQKRYLQQNTINGKKHSPVFGLAKFQIQKTSKVVFCSKSIEEKEQRVLRKHSLKDIYHHCSKVKASAYNSRLILNEVSSTANMAHPDLCPYRCSTSAMWPANTNQYVASYLRAATLRCLCDVLLILYPVVSPPLHILSQRFLMPTVYLILWIIPTTNMQRCISWTSCFINDSMPTNW